MIRDNADIAFELMKPHRPTLLHTWIVTLHSKKLGKEREQREAINRHQPFPRPSDRVTLEDLKKSKTHKWLLCGITAPWIRCTNESKANRQLAQHQSLETWIHTPYEYLTASA